MEPEEIDISFQSHSSMNLPFKKLFSKSDDFNHTRYDTIKLQFEVHLMLAFKLNSSYIPLHDN